MKNRLLTPLTIFFVCLAVKGQDLAVSHFTIYQPTTRADADKEQPPKLPLLNSVIKTLSGTIDESVKGYGGCQIELTLIKGQKAIEARGQSRLRYNLESKTCAGEFEVGEPQEAVLAWDRAHLPTNRLLKNPSEA